MYLNRIKRRESIRLSSVVTTTVTYFYHNLKTDWQSAILKFKKEKEKKAPEHWGLLSQLDVKSDQNATFIV